MSNDAIQHGDPGRLATLMGGAGDASSLPWGPGDLGAILAHQLRAPLLFDLKRAAAVDPVAASAPNPWAVAAAREIRSFGDLLGHRAPPRELLALAKDFAKGADSPARPSLPTEVASVLYFAAICAALLRLGERITTLDDRAIAEGAAWALGRPWLGADLRPLFDEAGRALRGETKGRGVSL